jgi:hypothetical protein
MVVERAAGFARSAVSVLAVVAEGLAPEGGAFGVENAAREQVPDGLDLVVFLDDGQHAHVSAEQAQRFLAARPGA